MLSCMSSYSGCGIVDEKKLHLPKAVYKGSRCRPLPYRESVRDRRAGSRQTPGHLKTKGIGTEVYYPVPLHRQECLASLGYHEADFPVAERACRELLALPVYPELNEDQQHYVVQAIREWFER